MAAGPEPAAVDERRLSAAATAAPAPDNARAVSAPAPAQPVQKPEPSASVTLPLSSFKSNSVSSVGSTRSVPAAAASSIGSISSISRLNTSQDSQVLHDTLTVINEHITDLRSPSSNGALRNGTDSESEYSSHLEQRMSYIQGEETDEEEDGQHTRQEVEAWSADDVAEFLFTAGVEKQHCEVFRDQEITGEVLLGMDQTSIFIKAFELGSVGRRLKTWQRVKALQDEVNGQAPSTRRNTGTQGSDVGSDDARRSTRSRTNTPTSSMQKLPPIDSRPGSLQAKRQSVAQTPRLTSAQPTSPVSPVSPISTLDGSSPTRALHEKRPSAASVRDLHHSRRHSSTEYRLTSPGLTKAGPPKLMSSGTFPPAADATAHKKQPSFDRNWTLGNATMYNNGINNGIINSSSTSNTHQRPLSSAGFPEPAPTAPPETELGDSAIDLDRGYFSGPDVDGRRRNVLKKRDSVQAHSRDASYAEEQRVRSATALSRHSRFGSVDSVRESGASPAAQKYYGLPATGHRRTASTNTTESIRPVYAALKDAPSPTVTRLDDGLIEIPRSSPISPVSPAHRQGMHGSDWLSKPSFKAAGLGLRAISDAVTGQERSKALSPAESSMKDSPIHSPSRTGSSTPSAGPSFELDSPDAKSPSTAMSVPSARSANVKKKGKKETSAYQRGLLAVTPREAMKDADYSGWMKKKSSNLMTTWKPRLFVLKGRRLAYYYSEDDDQEKGLIDISFHRVLPADNERLTGLHATLTGASNTPTMPAGSQMPTLAATEALADTTRASDSIFIFKLVPPRAGLSRAVNFTKPTVHYFAVPNIKQGRLWMAALMKATIDRDDTTPITTTYQQKTISLAKARQMRHRPPALMNLDERLEDTNGDEHHENTAAAAASATATPPKKEMNGLGIVCNENDSGISGLGRLGLQKVESASASARSRHFPFEPDSDSKIPLSA